MFLAAPTHPPIDVTEPPSVTVPTHPPFTVTVPTPPSTPTQPPFTVTAPRAPTHPPFNVNTNSSIQCDNNKYPFGVTTSSYSVAVAPSVSYPLSSTPGVNCTDSSSYGNNVLISFTHTMFYNIHSFHSN